MYRYYITITFLAFLGIFVSSLAIGEEINPAKAITVMKNLEKQFQGIQFTALLAKPPSLFERSVIYDFTNRRYFVEDKTVAEWRDGAADYISCIERFSHDGKLFYEWRQCKHGTQFPEKDAASHGMMTDNMKDSSMNENFNSFKNGVGIGLPLMFYDMEGKYCSGFYEHTCMSKYLTEWVKQNNLESIVSLHEGVWTITSTFVSRIKKVKVRLVVDYDINKNGFVTNAKYYYTMPDKQKQDEFLANEFIIDTVQDSEGNWVPTTLRKINFTRGETVLFQYKNVKLLRSISSDMVQMDFPDGTQVSDMVHKMEYKVGDLIDEDKAIDLFIKKHHLERDHHTNTPYRVNVLRYILMTLGIILIIIGIGRLYVKWRKK
jgi:hypothetical protein